MRIFFSTAVALVCLLSAETSFATAFMYQSDPTRSAISGIARKGGLFSSAGHDHAVFMKNLDFKFCMDRDVQNGSKFEINIPTESIQVDVPADRVVAGLNEKGPDAEDQKKIRQKMLAESVLDAQHYPTIKFKVNTIAKQPNVTDIAGTLTVKGFSKDLSFFTNTVVLEHGVLHSWGEFTINMLDFHIEPPSFLAFVTVKDEMTMKFDIFLLPSAEPCKL